MCLPEGQFLIRTCLAPQFSLQMAAVFPAATRNRKKHGYICKHTHVHAYNVYPGPLLLQAHSRKCKSAQQCCAALTLALAWNSGVLFLPVSPAILPGSSDVCAIVIQPTIARTRSLSRSLSRSLPAHACCHQARALAPCAAKGVYAYLGAAA
jgi:hypothetical protein